MKKLIISLFMAAAAICVSAQDSDAYRADSLQTVLDDMTAQIETEELNKKIWGKGRFTRLGYAIAQTAEEYSPVEKSKFSFFLTKGTTYLFPKKPIAGLLKIGLDAVWFDIQATKYNSPYSSLNWTSEFVEEPTNSEYEDFEEEITDIDLNIGCWGVSMGMGIGPNVSVAPFALTSITGLQPLRVSLYFHYAPTMQLYLKSQDGDVELSSAFCHMMNFGGTLSYRAIGIGFEGRWGKGKFKPLDFSSIGEEGDESESLGAEKYTRRFANSRIYIQFRF